MIVAKNDEHVLVQMSHEEFTIIGAAIGRAGIGGVTHQLWGDIKGHLDIAAVNRYAWYDRAGVSAAIPVLKLV